MAIAYVAIYLGGLVLSWVHFGGGDDLFAGALVPVMAWSLACGLATVRYEALLAPAGVIGAGILFWLATTDGVITYSYDTGPITLLFYPIAGSIVMAALAVPVGAGIAIARLLQPERAARAQSLLASLEERR